MDMLPILNKVVIRQIIPAEGWYAHFSGGDGYGETYSKIVCWALVDETVDFRGEPHRARNVIGLVMIEDEGLCPANAPKNFAKYIQSHEIPEGSAKDVH